MSSCSKSDCERLDNERKGRLDLTVTTRRSSAKLWPGRVCFVLFEALRIGGISARSLEMVSMGPNKVVSTGRISITHDQVMSLQRLGRRKIALDLSVSTLGWWNIGKETSYVGAEARCA